MAKKQPRAADLDLMPFDLPARPTVTQIRKRDAYALRHPTGSRTQPLRGFDAQYLDIVDYIVRITEEIWVDRAIGRIYTTYDHACTVYSHYGVVRSVEEVIASTAATLNAFPDGEAHHLNVAWRGDEDSGFYTSHLGFSRSTNLGPSTFGPATGRRVGVHFCADCVSFENRIHTEWLVRDNGALVRQLGLDVHQVARELAQVPPAEVSVLSVPTRMIGQSPRQPLDIPTDTPEGYMRTLFHDVWNLRRLDRINDCYTSDSVCHAGGGRLAVGRRNYCALLLGIMTSLPDATISVEHVCHSEETDGVIVAVRWVLSGTTRKGGVLGDVPDGRPVAMHGMTHCRFVGNRIVEEWMLFDEVGVLVNAYRP